MPPYFVVHCISRKSCGKAIKGRFRYKSAWFGKQQKKTLNNDNSDHRDRRTWASSTFSNVVYVELTWILHDLHLWISWRKQPLDQNQATCEIDFRWDWTMVWFILLLLLSQPFHCHAFICFQIITNFPFAFLHVCSLFLINTVTQPSPLYFSIVNSAVRITDEYIEMIQQSSRKTVQGVIVLPCMNSPWPSTLIEFSNKRSATSHEKIEECNFA